MIRRNLRRLAARIDARRFAGNPDHRAFIRLAYELGGRGEPGEDAYKRHEADLAGGLTYAELIRALAGETLPISGEEGPSAENALLARVSPEDADALVRLAFRSLLRRDADAETYADYRTAFELGTTSLDLLNDITQSEEFKIINEHIEHLLAASNHSPSSPPTLDHSIASDMGTALTLLEACLSQKGCKLQLGAVPVGAVDGSAGLKRVRSLMITLSLMEKL